MILRGRLEQLIGDLGDRFPDDWWMQGLAEEPPELMVVDSYFLNIYGSALDILDDSSWKYLRGKATECFCQNTERRGKQPFFNVLNEALAYQHLHNLGLSVSLLRAAHETGGEVNGKQPDMKFSDGTQDFFCEVKTIGPSEAELDRYESKEVFSGDVYSELSSGFFRKLSSDIDSAIQQFPQEGPGNLIYVIMNLDDWMGLNYDRYQEQIKQHLALNHGSTQVYCRAGVSESFHVHHLPADA